MKTIAAILLVPLLLLASPALAQRDHDHDRARRAVQAGEVLPLAAILDKVARDYPGDVIETELEDGHDGPVYEIKLITPQGQVMKIIYDARDGSVLKVKGKRP